MTSRSDVTIARLLVAGQFTLLAVLGTRRRRDDWPTPPWLRRVGTVATAGGVAAAVAAGRGLGPGLTASPLPNDRAVLRTEGPYAVVRHPIYSGLLLTATARAVASGNRATVAPTAALWALLTVKAHWEEQRLRRRFPEYAGYAARTPRLIPALGRSVSGRPATADSPKP